MNTRTENSADLTKYNDLVGKEVSKKSGKPFKSGKKVNTVKGITIHKETNHSAFEFFEDDSQVECWRCEKIS